MSGSRTTCRCSLQRCLSWVRSLAMTRWLRVLMRHSPRDTHPRPSATPSRCSPKTWQRQNRLDPSWTSDAGNRTHRLRHQLAWPRGRRNPPIDGDARTREAAVSRHALAVGRRESEGSSRRNFRRWRGVIARFSLIHIDPQTLPGIFATWASRLRVGAHVMVAIQCSEDPTTPVREFDHRVAQAWRWHPDAMEGGGGGTASGGAGHPTQDSQRFAECHLLCRLAT